MKSELPLYMVGPISNLLRAVREIIKSNIGIVEIIQALGNKKVLQCIGDTVIENRILKDKARGKV